MQVRKQDFDGAPVRCFFCKKCLRIGFWVETDDKIENEIIALLAGFAIDDFVPSCKQCVSDVVPKVKHLMKTIEEAR